MKIKYEIKEGHYDNGNISYQKYYANNRLHREDGPAEIIKYYQNGAIKTEDYYINGKRHRESKPARISYYENGNIKYISYYLNDKCHKEDGPACIYYYENGNVQYEEYYINGKLHKENGPAVIWYHYDNKGNYTHETKNYYINDNNLTSYYDKYKNNLTERMIKTQKDIEKLKIMKIVCIENNNDELLNLIK